MGSSRSIWAKEDGDPDYATEIAAWNASLFCANNTDDIQIKYYAYVGAIFLAVAEVRDPVLGPSGCRRAPAARALARTHPTRARRVTQPVANGDPGERGRQCGW